MSAMGRLRRFGGQPPATAALGETGPCRSATPRYRSVRNAQPLEYAIPTAPIAYDGMVAARAGRNG